jgi:glycosyltransferase involved in cell wall biosynthesis
MDIAIISCVFPPETSVAGRINLDIAKEQKRIGNQVTVISPKPSRPLGKFDKIEAFDIINEQGFRHICIDSFVHPETGLFGRVLESLSFGYKSAKCLNKIKHQTNDLIIYCMPWPFLGQLAFLAVYQRKKSKIVFNIQDLYPESFINRFSGSILVKALNFLKPIDSFIAKQADHITVVSESMAAEYLYHRKIDPRKITVIENWQDESPFLQEKNDKKTILKQHSIEHIADKFVFMYLGNIGPVAGVDEILRDCAKYKTQSIFEIVIAGSGSLKTECRKIVQEHKLNYVTFVEIETGIESVVALQSVADVMLLPMKAGSGMSSMPSKMIAYMYSAKPILTSADHGSFTQRAISDGKCGWIKNDNENWFDVLNRIASFKENELIKLGLNARSFALQRYSKRLGLQKINNLLKKMF